MTRKLPELLTGLAVIVIAIVFLVYALGTAGAINAGGYPLIARFSSISGLTIGADVKIGGVKIGRVASERLDPATYAAIVELYINNDIKIPTDSSAAVSSDGLLGGSYIAVAPGGSNSMMNAGQSFPVTQSAINIEELLGKFIFSMGGGSSGSSKPAATTSSSPADPSPGNTNNPALPAK